jgi:hypothetical protein
MGAETDQPGPTPTLLVQSTPRGRAVVPTMVEGQRGFCRKFHFATLWSRISISATEDHTRGRATMVSFKGAHFVKAMILTCVRWYLAYPLSDRQVEELMEERGVSVDHATVHRWVLKYSPQLADAFHRHKRPVGRTWQMDETSIRVKGEWRYL